MKALLPLLLLLSAIASGTDQPRPPRKVVLYVGGGGEPRGDSTKFDNAVRTAGRFYSSAKWEPTVLFDGDRPKSTEAVLAGFGVASQAFTPSNFERQLERVKEQIKNGELREGDQFLLNINTHGDKPVTGVASHFVATDERKVSLDQVLEIRDLLENAKIRFAIIDGSCYSGSTMHLATDKTCVLSVTAPDALGDESTVETLYSKLQAGRSLEDVFLAARKDHDMWVLPEISSPAGKKATSELRPLIHALITSREELQVAEELGRAGCTLDQSDPGLTQLLSDLQAISSRLPGQDLGLTLAIFRKFNDVNFKFGDLAHP